MCLLRVIICLRPVIKIVPNLLQNNSRMAPRMAPKWLENRSRGLLESSWSCLGRLEASWKPLGALLEASGVEKNILRAALGRSKRNLKTGFSYLGSQNASKTEPQRIQNGVQNRVRAEKGEITKKRNTSSTKTSILMVQGLQKRIQNGSKIGSQSHLRRGSPRKAS